MKRFTLLPVLLCLTSCAFLKSVFSPAEVAAIDQCLDSQLQPAISALFSRVMALAVQPATSATAAALDAIAAEVPQGEAAVGCILKSIAIAGRQALDGGTIEGVITGATASRHVTVLDPVSQSNADANVEAYEIRHRRIAVLPTQAAQDAGK